MPAYEFDGVVPVVDPTAFVHETASLIGDVIVGPGCYIGPFASLRGDFGRILIGEGSNVQDSCVIHAFPGKDAILEPNSHIGHAAVLHGCRIGSYALIGIGATILDGAEIGENALVAAGAVVTARTSIPAAGMAMGCPAKVTGTLDEQALAWKRNGVHIYQQLAQRSRQTLRPVRPHEVVEPDRRRTSWSADAAEPLHVKRSAGS
ncbi:gamma carbonic anhydrase family protein [Microbacterium sp. NIBRBAC000506063]|uniref:gamma carbonic anhydrase family protein n=1 Tax=Microbacterium sp. NIBRBAC000506063 TaxID=2734618 RepID=UPI001BB4BE98|nr:gamma carbonic anhydrase family protein [Microbacterium sp. NIBRBAC000506063]QTV79082.1 gamma carbonic anhydrase family protein [Microbacterium sp. NIBRBAC000506063]